MSVAAVAIEIGSVAVKHILKLWFKDGSLASDESSSLIDMLETKTKDVFARRKGILQFEEMATQIGESLYPMFEQESRLDEGDRVHVAEAVRDAFNHARLSNDIIIEKNLDPTYLARIVRDASPLATRDMSEVAAALYDRTIQETCVFIVNIATQLPAFTERTFAEILARENQLIDAANKTLEMLRKMQEHLDPTIEAEDFERKYREAVARNLDILQLIGADVSLPNRRHRLSVAYITLSVEQKRALPSDILPSSEVSASEQDEQADIWETLPVHTALANSSRLLIRGQAGSGKTTLMQWVAVRAATKSFEDELVDWNGMLPFYIRLRAYAQTDLPRPEMFPQFVAPMIVERMPKGWVHSALESGRALVLIDGVDEISASQRETAHTWLNDLVATYLRTRFIVTSRPHAIQEGWMNRYTFDDAELQPMELADIDVFIDHWHAAVREELQHEEEKSELSSLAEHLKEQVKQHSPLRRLATNPLLCAMLCALSRDRRRHLPINRIELYRACCDLLLERREKESRIDLRDYPALGLGQKERLLQDLAYWMLQENLTEVDKAQVDARFSAQLSNMVGIAHEITGTDVRRFFVERAGIIREPVEGRIDFTHRTFEEFYAAQALIQASSVQALVANALLDQWREVIILFAGLASQAVSEQLIAGLLQRGDNEPAYRHSLHSLAVSCLETVIQLRPEIRAEVEKRLKKIVPPKNITEAKAVAAAGDLAVKYLRKNAKQSATAAAACVRALALIGSDTALDALETYADDPREGVIKELLKAWGNFDRKDFARRIFSRIAKSSLRFERVATLEGLEYIPRLTDLNLWRCDQVTDLSPLAHLTSLTSIRISGCNRGTDLSPLAHLTKLRIVP